MMTATARNIRITDGTSQDDRFPIALQEGYVHVDERSHEDLLATGVEYAALLNYYSLDNRPDPGIGWHTFFTADAAIIMAIIQTTDLAGIDSHFRDVFLRNAGHQETKLSAIPNWRLAKKVDRWFKALKAIESEAGRQLVEKIAGLINEKLRHELSALVRFLAQYNTNVAGIVQRDFDRLWLQAPTAQTRPAPVPAPSDGKEAIDRFFKSNFYAFFNAVRVLMESSRRLFPGALKSRAHDPTVGLYIAFAKLFENVQHKVNRFTQQHLDFYYYDVLKVRSRRIVPDSTYLIFRPDVAGRRVHIPRGTEFAAGVDDNNRELIYTADNDLTVTGAAVAALATLFIERDPLISPERELAFSSGARARRIPLLEDNGGGNGPQAFPTFGAPKSGSETLPHQEADFGFALASPVLLLKEGRRDITVTLRTEFRPGSGVAGIADFVNQIKRIISKNAPAAVPQEIAADAAGQDPFELDAFFKAFRHMFIIHLTTETGWHEVSEYLPLSQVVDRNQYDKNSLSLQFCLSPEVAAVVPYSRQIHGGQFETELPIMRFMINPEAYIYPYSLLKQMVVHEIEIEVAVNGVRGVLLYNNLGRLDPNGPFNPFGPSPAVGSYFIVGNFEAARKQLTRFEVEIEWGDLPALPGGFQEYYQAYGMPFDNGSFAVQMAALNGGRWLPAEEQKRPRVALFESKNDAGDGPPSGRIRKERRLSCQAVVPFYKPVELPAASTEFGYSTQAKNGFFKFTLSDPAFAFGHADYPALLANVLTANTRLSKFRILKPLPNPPYTPLINVISVNYRAAARIDLAQFNPTAAALAEEKLFHIHPFGIEAVSPASRRTVRLLPSYDSDGNLFIGLSAGEIGGVITLFFHLREDSSAAANGDRSEFSWHYLSSNEWKRLEPNRVISDTTEGFRTAGIITLDLPQDINRDSSIMPDGLFWLRVSLDGHPEAPCSLYAVFTHALKVSWRPGDHSLAHLQTSLPAGTIKEARTSIPGISQIRQIVDSFGGRLPESPSQLKIRISERLKHKNRATTAWDYERLILERFPEILKVKCFDNMVADPQNFIRPGHILIVVIPHLRGQSPESLQPMVNSGLLARIKAFVTQLASPFARIEVRNPAYERIQIRCTVKLRRGIDQGYAINALNQALNAYLSPWHKTGYRARFGWKVRRYDLESYIQRLEYVEYVEKFSMLRIVEHQQADGQIEDQGPFDLLDTVPAVQAVVISGDRRRLVTTGSDGTARVWDLDAPDPAASQRVLRGHQGGVLAAAFSPDGRLLVTTGFDRTARIWDLSARDPLKTRQVLAGHAGAVLSAVVSPDGRRLATTGCDHTACIWDLEADDPARTRQILEGHTGAVLGAVFSPDGRRLVTAGSDRTARIWDLTARDPSRSAAVLTGHRDAVTAAAISPDGRHLVTTGHDNTVRIWDLGAQEPSQSPRVLRGHAGTVLAVAFSADGSRLATAGRDNTARLWDLRNTQRDEALQVFEGHEDALLAVAISPDGRRLVTAGCDNTVRLWDLAADDHPQMPRILRVAPDAGMAPAETGTVPWVPAAAVSPDSLRLATVSSDNTVRLWDLTAEDSAATPIIDLGSADEEVREIRPAYPWSIATPVRRHFIRTTDGTAPKPPQKTGVDELEIGSTFIITGK